MPAGQKLQIASVTKVSAAQVQILDVDDDFYRSCDVRMPLLSEVLDRWKAALPVGIEHLWPQIDCDGGVQKSALKPQQFREMLRERFRRAGVPYQRPHSFRAGCITELARRGATSLQIGRTSGHRSERMILRYTQLAQVTP